MESSGVYYALRRGCLEACVAPAPWVDRLCAEAQQYLQSILSQHIGPIPELAQGSYIAMLLGKTSALSFEQKNAFKLSGTLHLFAISGMHIAVIAGFLFWCLKHVPMHDFVRTLIGLQILAMYVMITGGAPSAWRAFLMVALFWAGIALQRQTMPFAVLVATAMGVLLWNPVLLWNVGFQLSYMVVAGILLYGIPFAAYLSSRKELFVDPSLEGWGSRTKRTFAQTVAITFAANVSSIPLIIIHFGLFSVVGFGLNLILVPWASAGIVLGFLSLAIGGIGLSWVAAAINTVAVWLLWGLEQVVYQGIKIPGSTFQVAWSQAWGIFVLAGLWGLWIVLPPKPGAVWRFWLTPIWCFMGVLGGFLGA